MGAVSPDRSTCAVAVAALALVWGSAALGRGSERAAVGAALAAAPKKKDAKKKRTKPPAPAVPSKPAEPIPFVPLAPLPAARPPPPPAPSKSGEAIPFVPLAPLPAAKAPAPIPAPAAATPRAPTATTPPIVAPAAAPAPPTYRRVDAERDKPAPTEPPTLEWPVPERTPRPGVGITVSPRIGAYLPHTALNPGFTAGLEVGYEALIDGAVRLSAGIAWVTAAWKGERTVTGRGYDPAFVRNATMVPIDLSVGYVALRGQPLEVTLGLGLSMTWGRAEQLVLGDMTAPSGWAAAFLAGASARYRVGPGRAFVDVRHSEGQLGLGPLGTVDTAHLSLSATAIAAGYAVAF